MVRAKPNHSNPPRGTWNKEDRKMKYQIADLNNGPFGEIFDNLKDAEAALAEVIAEGQAENDLHASEYAEAGREVPQAADFFEVVEIED
jgi:hypothetical protein